jgi:hypothetical protein
MIPGSALYLPASPSPPRTVPQVPDDHGPRDARLDIVAKTVGGESVQNASIVAYVMIGGRAHFSASGVTDAGGVLRMQSLPRGEHYVVVDKPGFARASAMVITEAGARRLDVTMQPEHMLTVEVVDETHSPVAGAEVEVSAGEPVPIGARTGDDGKVAVGRLGAGPFSVRVQVPGYEVVTRDRVNEGETCTIALARLAALVVTVVDAQEKPVARATVAIASAQLYPPRATETDEAGHVRIGGLSPGSYALRASRGGDVSESEVAVTLGRAEEKNVTLTLGAGASTTVIVTDAEDDSPIAGARVTLAEGGLSPFPLEAVTNKEGRAVVGPYTRGHAVLTVRADEYVAKGGIPASEDGTPVKVSLGKGAVIEGRILDARGYAIDGATFVVVGTDESGLPIDDDPRARAFSNAHFSAALAGPAPLMPAGELGVVPGPVPPIPERGAASSLLGGGDNLAGSRAPPDASEPWISRRDGTFTLSPVTPGRVRLLARHPEYTDVFGDVIALAPGGKAKVDLVMRRGGSIEGRVVDPRGRGVEGAEVTVAATHGSMERSARTASDGSFAFASLPDSVTLLVSDAHEPGEPLARAVVDVKEGAKTNVTLTMPEPRAPLAVRVVDDRGRGVGGAIVTAASLDPNEALHATAFSDADGELTIPRASELSVRLDVRAPGWASLRVRAATKDLLKIELRAAVPVVGVVETDRGEPIAGAEVTAYGDLGAMHALTDKDGAYRFGELGEGSIRVSARANGRAPAEVTATVTATHGRAFAPPKLVLHEEAIAAGIVVDEAGKLVSGARVAKDVVSTYLAAGALPAGVVTTTRDGHFTLGQLPAGDVTLEALAPDVGRGSISVHLDGGRTTRDVKIVIAHGEDDSARERAAGGVAVTLGETSEPREVVLVAVAESSEAERAGLVPNDVVLEVDGQAVTTMKEARQHLSGPLSDEAVLKIRRGENTLVFRVPREAVRK